GAGLREVVVRDAALRLLEEGGTAGPALHITEANWRPFETGRSKAWVQILSDDGSGWDLTVERSRGRLGEAAVSIEVEDLPLSALVPDLADDDGGPFIHSALTLQARMVAGRDGKLVGIRGTLSAASGILSFTGKDRIRLASAGLSFTLGATGHRLKIPSGEVRTEEGSVRFAGEADLREPGSMTVLGRVLGGALPTGRQDQPRVQLVGGGALARIDFADRSLEIERLHVVTPEVPLSAIGQASLGGSAPGLSFALSLSPVSAPVLRAFWPPFIASNTRRWFDDNVVSGTIGPGTVRVALPPEFIGPRGKDRILPSYALLGTLPFEDAVFSPLKTFPKVRNGAGELGFANGTLTVRATSGVVEMPGKGSLEAAGTTLAIPELGRAKPRGNLHLVLSGSVAALAALSDIPPLSIAAENGIVADALSGSADLVLDANIPLHGDTLDDVSPDFQLSLTDFTSTRPIEERLIGDADLVLEGTPESFTVEGEGQLDGIQATIDLILGSAAPDQTDVKLELDDEAREKLGLGFAGMVTGPVQAAIKNSGEHAQEVALDLKQARISLASLGWEKGPGVPATAVFVMEEIGSETRITDLVVSGKGFSAKGSLTIAEDGIVKEMELTQAALRPGDRLSLTAVATDKGYEVKVGGEAFDARGIIRSIGAHSEGDTLDIFPIRIALDLASVTGENDVVLQDISGSVVLSADGLDSVFLKGAADGSAAFEWSLDKDGKARLLRLLADDGGALVRFAGVYSKVVGGRLILDYSGMVGGPGTGVVTLRDFRLFNETALAPALQASSGSGSEAAARIEAGSGDLNFSQLRVPFRQQDWVIYIDDAALRGPMLGATGSGTINLPGGKMAISGTFIPAFGLNNIAGSIPLIGGILGGGRDEGLVGITYKLFGPLDNPKLNMNPISAIAPGIFRRIFEYN
ncbi:MAG TPA: AsmA-like C-terminal domain-containing protein, partial [Propylenella sp.]|nr:AsmA-like C-terminal domain-containing protein [Propylenella sp.]